ncbi:MAG: DNA polymerase IV [Bacteroidota bacterium]|nr:DNA polymerase IV [Bacteroidota bacterium]
MSTTSTYPLRQIMHMDLDTFFVSVERLLDPKLAKRPVIVGGSPFERGVVSSCSYETRVFGVHSAMPLRQAFRLCPQAVFLYPHFTHYAEYSKLVKDILSDIAPQIEKASVDEFYLDLSGCEKLKGNTYDWAKDIQKNVNGETQLPLSIGLSTNKLIAKVATSEFAKRSEAKSYKVEPGDEAQFLSPLPVAAMPGIGEATEKIFLTYGMHRIGQIAQTPVQLMTRLFGKNGKTIHQHANGIDLSPIIEQREQKSISRDHTFTEDTFDVVLVVASLHRLASDLAEGLRANVLLAQKIGVKLRYSDFHTVTKTASTCYTNTTQEIYRIAEKLLRSVWTRRQRIRLIGIEAHDFIHDLQQLYLFGEDKQKKEGTIDSVVDSIRHKYGDASIAYASHLVH